MTRLTDYRSALLAAFPEVSDPLLLDALNAEGERFASFVVDHGLGPMWHARTGREEFYASRLSAEAHYLAQEHTLRETDDALNAAGVEYTVIKGAASRLLLQENPALRACYDIDLLVRPEDRVRAAAALLGAGFSANFRASNISHELLFTRDAVDIDLHWGLLRAGRLEGDCSGDMLSSRRRLRGMWMLNAEDAFFVLIVHPAFAKHLDGWGMGLHRVADIVAWLKTQSFDWQAVCTRLEQNGVRTAAWATLRWVEMLTRPNAIPGLDKMLLDLRPGRLRRTWLDNWLRNDLSARTSGLRWVRLLGFSLFLHDMPRDSLRALSGRYRAYQQSSADLEAFQDLVGQQAARHQV